MTEHGVFAKYNAEQRRALATAKLTASGLVLIQGPPGTGKSHVIASAEGLANLCVAKGRVFILCRPNKAVDSIAMRLLDSRAVSEEQIARVGYEKNADERIRKFFIPREDERAYLKHKKVVLSTIYHLKKSRSLVERSSSKFASRLGRSMRRLWMRR